MKDWARTARESLNRLRNCPHFMAVILMYQFIYNCLIRTVKRFIGFHKELDTLITSRVPRELNVHIITYIIHTIYLEIECVHTRTFETVIYGVQRVNIWLKLQVTVTGIICHGKLDGKEVIAGTRIEPAILKYLWRGDIPEVCNMSYNSQRLAGKCIRSLCNQSITHVTLGGRQDIYKHFQFLAS